MKIARQEAQAETMKPTRRAIFVEGALVRVWIALVRKTNPQAIRATSAL